MRKVALITGAAAGIGAACAKRLARDGIAIGVLDLDEGRCAGTVDAIREAGGLIVVNNAGIVDFTRFEDLTDAAWDRMFAVNVRGPFAVIQECAPDMVAAQWGRIVNISSSSAQTGTASQVSYSSSKGAVVTMTRSLAEHYGKDGITVNNIPPGSVMQTLMSEANKKPFPIPTEELVKRVLVNRLGIPEDIAHTCAFLCDDAAAYITGQTIGVNGGRVPS